MREQGPKYAAARHLDDDQLLDHYPWPEKGTWVRAMMVTTLDGAAAGPDGLSGSISSSSDQRVFNAVRRHADAILIGAGTMRTELYAPMHAKPMDAKQRVASRQLPAPVIAVVSKSLNLPWTQPVWSESTHCPMVITGAGAGEELLETARRHADIIVLDHLTPHAIINSLTERGLRRIVCEGGPHLLRELVASSLIDEADITVAPVITGTASSPTTSLISRPGRFRLAHVIEDSGYLMTRYIAEDR